MTRRLIDLGARPILDLASYARRGPGRRDRLAPAELEIIARTVQRTPEVMVKVLTRGGQGLGSVARHLDYLNRKGELEIETDDGQRLKGKGVGKELLLDWDLDLDEMRPRADLGPRPRRIAPKLVHKLMFSMPAGTPPKKLLAAVKNFAREQFALKHRYAMVLHTDEPHPHVHMVVKAIGEDGTRLNIRRATLREWRAEFARHLREQGVPANATERAVRGEITPQKTDGIYRAARRGASTHWRKRADAVARELAGGGLKDEPAKARLLETRRQVLRAWNEIADNLVRQGEGDLALAVRKFAEQLPPPRTEKAWIAERLREQSKTRRREELHR
jgi:predicted transcriptional regulator